MATKREKEKKNTTLTVTGYWGKPSYCTCAGHKITSKCPVFRRMYYQAFINAFQ